MNCDAMYVATYIATVYSYTYTDTRVARSYVRTMYVTICIG